MPRKYREIVLSDVGKTVFHAFGRSWMTSGFIGRILQRDVGKRVYLIDDDVLQVENDEQRAKRLASEAVEPGFDPDTHFAVAMDSMASRVQDRNRWHSMYLGAFAALVVPNVAMAKELAELTISDEECVDTIRIMREAREGDRTWPALEHLRSLRKVEYTVRQRIAVLDKRPPEMKWAVLVRTDSYTLALSRAQELADEKGTPLYVFEGDVQRRVVEP